MPVAEFSKRRREEKLEPDYEKHLQSLFPTERGRDIRKRIERSLAAKDYLRVGLRLFEMGLRDEGEIENAVRSLSKSLSASLAPEYGVDEKINVQRIEAVRKMLRSPERAPKVVAISPQEMRRIAKLITAPEPEDKAYETATKRLYSNNITQPEEVKAAVSFLADFSGMKEDISEISNIIASNIDRMEEERMYNVLGVLLANKPGQPIDDNSLNILRKYFESRAITTEEGVGRAVRKITAGKFERPLFGKPKEAEIVKQIMRVIQTEPEVLKVEAKPVQPAEEIPKEISPELKPPVRPVIPPVVERPEEKTISDLISDLPLGGTTSSVIEHFLGQSKGWGKDMKKVLELFETPEKAAKAVCDAVVKKFTDAGVLKEEHKGWFMEELITEVKKQFESLAPAKVEAKPVPPEKEKAPPIPAFPKEPEEFNKILSKLRKLREEIAEKPPEVPKVSVSETVNKLGEKFTPARPVPEAPIVSDKFVDAAQRLPVELDKNKSLAKIIPELFKIMPMMSTFEEVADWWEDLKSKRPRTGGYPR